MSHKKSRIRETPTLSTDADSRTDTILERLRHLPIHTEKRTWSTQQCGLGPRYGGDSVHAKMLTRFTLEHIPVFRALLKIQIEIELRNTSSFLGLYSRLRSRSRSNSKTHPRFRALLEIKIEIEIEIKIEIEIELRNTSSFLRLYSRLRSRSNSGTHPRFQGSTRDRDRDKLRNTSSFLGLYSRSRLRSRSHQSTNEARSAPVRPRKKIT